MNAENLYAQVDEDGYRYQLLDSIIDHRNDGSQLSKADGCIQSKNGTQRKWQTTKGWDFLIQWKDGMESWCDLKELKESFPIEIAEYVTATGIQDEPAFAWWILFTLQKKDRGIAAVKARTK